MGGAPLFSIKRGEGNEKEAEAILGNSVTLLVIFGLCLTVVGLIVKDRFCIFWVQVKIRLNMQIHI